MKVLVVVSAALAALAVSSCGGDSSPSPSTPPGNPSSPAAKRLAWSQASPTEDAVRSYGFVLFIDGVGTPLPGAACTGQAPNFDCSAPLPSISPGSHVLQLSTVQTSTGAESLRSIALVLNQASRATIPDYSDGSTGEAAARLVATGLSQPARANAERPSTTCAGGHSTTCFSISLISDDAGAVQRLVALPDQRLLVLLAGQVVRILPSGPLQQLDVGRSGLAAQIADIAVDPNFLDNRFVYFATAQPGSSGRLAVSVVRTREVGDVLGEPATIAAEIPSVAAERPAMTVGPDRHIYIAVPSTALRDTVNGPYDGLVLRLRPDGLAAGYEQLHSPVLSIGSLRPLSFLWIDDTHLMLASSNVAGGLTLSMVPLRSASTQWPPAPNPVAVPANAAPNAKAIAAGSMPDGSTENHLFILTEDPPLLYLARLTTTSEPAILSTDVVPLGKLNPIAIVTSGSGDLIVAATSERNSSRTLLLRLRAL